MTDPARGRLVLRRVVGKRPLQHSDQRKWVKFGVHRQAFSSEPQVGLEISQRVAKMAASEAANGKSRLKYEAQIGNRTTHTAPVRFVREYAFREEVSCIFIVVGLK